MDTAELRRALRGPTAPELLARIEEVVAADPESPFSKAVGALFGLAQGTRGAPLQRRKDLASSHLRQRRPKDPSLPDNHPLSGKSQVRALDELLGRLASLLAPSGVVPASRESYRGVADEVLIELWDDGSVREVRNRNYVQAVDGDLDVMIIVLESIDDFEGFMASVSFRPGLNVGEIKVKAIVPDMVIVICRLVHPIADGQQGVISFDMLFARGWYPWTHWTLTNSSSREYLDIALRAPKGTPIEVRSIEQAGEPEGDVFNHATMDVELSSHGVARQRFVDYGAGQCRGLAWRLAMV